MEERQRAGNSCSDILRSIGSVAAFVRRLETGRSVSSVWTSLDLRRRRRRRSRAQWWQNTTRPQGTGKAQLGHFALTWRSAQLLEVC